MTTMQTIQDAEAEVFDIAEGLDYKDIAARAQNMFAWANECRATYISILDSDKRHRAIFRAYAWVNVLYFMNCEECNPSVFSAVAYREHIKETLRQKTLSWVIGAFEFYSVRGFIRAWREVIGTKPIVYFDFEKARRARELQGEIPDMAEED